MGNFLIRLFLFLAGLVVAASLAVALSILGVAWALRWAWARLTGRPVVPWVMRFDPRQGFENFVHRADPDRAPSAAEVVNRRARGDEPDARWLGDASRDVGDVSDVSDVSDVRPKDENRHP